MTHPAKGRGFDDPSRLSDDPPSKGEGDRSRQDVFLMTRPAKGRAVSKRRLPDDPVGPRNDQGGRRDPGEIQSLDEPEGRVRQHGFPGDHGRQGEVQGGCLDPESIQQRGACMRWGYCRRSLCKCSV